MKSSQFLDRGKGMEWIEVIQCTGEKWDKIWTLYEESFPEIERRSLNMQKKVIKDTNYYCIGIWEKEVLAAVLMYWKMKDGCFIEHFAVSPELRGKKYGSSILKEICRREKKIILEIEPPEDKMTIKRFCFYEREGFLPVFYEHYQTPFRKEDKRLPLRLLSYPKPVSKQEYEEFESFLNKKVSLYSE